MPATLTKGGAAWDLHLPWFEQGAHRVAISLDGARVGAAAALLLHARPGPACLGCCGLEGPGLAACTAGEATHFNIHMRDAHGHAVTAGPAAAFLVEVAAGEERCTGAPPANSPRAPRMCMHACITCAVAGHAPLQCSMSGCAARGAESSVCLPYVLAGSVIDKGRGLLEVAYTLQTAGPFSIAVTLPGAGAARTLSGVCLPGPLSLAHCTVLEHSAASVAGEAGTVLIQQADR